MRICILCPLCVEIIDIGDFFQCTHIQQVFPRRKASFLPLALAFARIKKFFLHTPQLMYHFQSKIFPPTFRETGRSVTTFDFMFPQIFSSSENSKKKSLQKSKMSSCRHVGMVVAAVDTGLHYRPVSTMGFHNEIKSTYLLYLRREWSAKVGSVDHLCWSA